MTYPDIEVARQYVRGEDQRTTRLHIIEPALDSAIEQIEGHCGRTFAQVIDGDTAPTERTYIAAGDGVAHVDDFWTTDDLVVVVGSRTLSSSSYTLEPLNGVCDGVDGFPYWSIRSDSISRGDTVKVTARWGWESVPKPVVQAVLQLTSTLAAISDTPLGVVGMGEFGAVRAPRNLLGLVEQQLSRYRKVVNVVPAA